MWKLFLEFWIFCAKWRAVRTVEALQWFHLFPKISEYHKRKRSWNCIPCYCTSWTSVDTFIWFYETKSILFQQNDSLDVEEELELAGSAVETFEIISSVPKFSELHARKLFNLVRPKKARRPWYHLTLDQFIRLFDTKSPVFGFGTTVLSNWDGN